MSVDIVKLLDRAKRFVEKNRLDDAIEAYQAVLASFPNHLESIQSLGDLYTMQNRPDRAAVYYGMLFDRFTAPREEPKALALYAHFLKPHQQPPERVARYALLLQKQNRPEEAIEQYMSAALAFELTGKGDDALTCFVRMAQLDPENRERHIAVAEFAERMGNAPAAARGYLRAGQLTTENAGESLDYFARAHHLMPNDRSAALLYAQAQLRNGDAAAAAALLAPMVETEKDATFLELYAEALMKSGQLDTARIVLERMTSQGAGSAEKFFPWSTNTCAAARKKKPWNFCASRKKACSRPGGNPNLRRPSIKSCRNIPSRFRLAEFRAALYGDLNRETKYFEALVSLFDLDLASDQIPQACECLEKLVEIDPVRFRESGAHGSAAGPRGRRFFVAFADAAVQRRDSCAGSRAAGPVARSAGRNVSRDSGGVRSAQSLEDLLVQAEIFVQYSLQSKAIERLQQIMELFPGEDERNERLHGLFQAAHWWPQAGAAPARVEQRPQPILDEPAPRPAAYAPETLRDLAKISEINQNVFRQPSPRAMLSVAVNEVGNYLHATRCLAVVGTPGQPPQMASEFCASGVEPSSGSQHRPSDRADRTRYSGLDGRIAAGRGGGTALQ